MAECNGDRTDSYYVCFTLSNTNFIVYNAINKILIDIIQQFLYFYILNMVFFLSNKSLSLLNFKLNRLFIGNYNI